MDGGKKGVGDCLEILEKERYDEYEVWVSVVMSR